MAVVYTIVAIDYVGLDGPMLWSGRASLMMSSAMMGAVAVALTNGLERLLSVDLNEQVKAEADDLGML